MGKTFEDLRGKRYRADNFNGVDCDQDIVSDEVTNYYACFDGEPIVEVSKEVSEALQEYYQN